MKRVKQDCCENKPHKCCGIMKTIFGIGIFCAVIYAAHTWLETVCKQDSEFKDYAD